MPNQSIAERKRELRRQARRAVAALSETERGLRSRSACARLGDWPAFKSAKTIMAYLATPEEVDLSRLIAQARQLGKRVCLPRMDWSAKVISPVISGGKSLATEVREFGIAEPTPGEVCPLEEIDLVLVPGVAFDAAGTRLGRGAGFYDRFLASYRSARAGARKPALAVGLCFDAQVLPAIPAEAHDQHMDAVASERRLVDCRRPARRADKS